MLYFSKAVKRVPFHLQDYLKLTCSWGQLEVFCLYIPKSKTLCFYGQSVGCCFGTAVFSSVWTSVCSGMHTAYRKQRTYVGTNSRFVGYIHSPRVFDFWWNGEIRLRGLQTARIPAGKEARPAIQPCDTLATLPSELLTPEVSHHLSARGPFVFWTRRTQWADWPSSQRRSSALWKTLLNCHFSHSCFLFFLRI